MTAEGEQGQEGHGRQAVGPHFRQKVRSHEYFFEDVTFFLRKENQEPQVPENEEDVTKLTDVIGVEASQGSGSKAQACTE